MKMKKFLPYLIAIALVATILVMPGKADDLDRRWGWKPYDDFEEPAIDLEKWIVRERTADIYLEDGKACFEYTGTSSPPAVSNWLIVNEYVDKLRGIRADVTVEWCTGDVRGRLGGYIGEVPTGVIFGQLGLEGARIPPRVFGSLGVEDPAIPNSYDDIMYSRFDDSLEIIENTHTVEMTFSRSAVAWYLEDYGRLSFIYPERLESYGDRFFLGIGTRTTNGDAPCKVCFDNVWILTNNSTKRYK
jgi:hypothetical protein